ncbi:hypothetical protein J2T57_001601 [Natronocella acetinitrilica]|uniref:Uncharacterized protein n=1 Tax=Natronocella acetinitrilica TaxID=414046 RepID=A0AAE3G2M4_9GAMM|nr:hypothetical protein [Natronocella acetinitrilica]MCP1674499.1 hypothetical protein [Natronocella acetinitrilica]
MTLKPLQRIAASAIIAAAAILAMTSTAKSDTPAYWYCLGYDDAEEIVYVSGIFLATVDPDYHRMADSYRAYLAQSHAGGSPINRIHCIGPGPSREFSRDSRSGSMQSHQNMDYAVSLVPWLWRAP